MHITRPYFNGYSTLARIVDKENTIENNRKKKKTQINKDDNYYLIGLTHICKDSFFENTTEKEFIKNQIKKYRGPKGSIMLKEEFHNILRKDEKVINYFSLVFKIAKNRVFGEKYVIPEGITEHGEAYKFSMYVTCMKKDILKKEIKDRVKK